MYTVLVGIMETVRDSMSDMILYVSVIALGGAIGARLRGKEEKIAWGSKAQTLAIMVLVILMGARMGSNEQVINNIGTIGVTALVMTLAILFFSVVCLFFARKAAGFRKDASLNRKSSARDVGISAALEADTADSIAEIEQEMESEEQKSGLNKMTMLIFFSVIVGMALGYFVARPIFGSEIARFDHAASLGIKTGLCILMIFVGLELGLQGTVFQMMRDAGLRILLFPAVTIVGTFIGSAVSGPLMGFSLREAMAVGAGFGWYSLAPGIIMDAGLIEASAVSFLHNVLREIISILLLPVVAEKIGYSEAACMGGAPAMDVCLPVSNKETKGKAVTYGFVSGVIMSFLVPVSVPLVLSIF